MNVKQLVIFSSYSCTFISSMVLLFKLVLTLVALGLCSRREDCRSLKILKYVFHDWGLGLKRPGNSNSVASLFRVTSSSARVRWIVLRLFPLHSPQFSKQRRRVLIGVLITYIYRCRCRVLVDNNLNLFTTAQTAPFSQKNRLAFRES